MKISKGIYRAFVPVAILVIGAVLIWIGGGLKAASNGGDIGFVDVQRIMNQHKDFKDASASLEKEFARLQEQLNSEAAKLQNELNTKVKGMQDQEKIDQLRNEYAAKIKKIQGDYQSQLDKQKADVLKNIETKLDAAIASVAREQNLQVVLKREIVLYGGKDVTDTVLKKLEANSKK